MEKLKIPFSPQLIKLASLLSKPLYAVGGYVRNYLIDKTISTDIDLAGAISVQEIKENLQKVNYQVFAEYKRTATLVFGDEKFKFEYTVFRKEEYGSGGGHTPICTTPTDSLEQDAIRRDFKCNAVYYDIKNSIIVDPLGGVEDIKNRVIDTVVNPSQVFSHDGLRLMRLARQSAELNFTPTDQVLQSARDNADNILDISAERIFAELIRILESDNKYSFSSEKGHYEGLKILDETRVLDRILPELTLGRDMAQRQDYHNYDVLEHSLKTVLYSPRRLRLVALLHDVGKPFCMIRDGKYHFHAVEGQKIASKILTRLKAPKKIIKDCEFLIGAHMLDMKRDMKEVKIRKFIALNQEYLQDLLAIKQADFTACKDNKEQCFTVSKWREIYQKMINENTPFCLKQLDISASEVISLGFKGAQVGKKLNQLFLLCVENPALNQKEKLIKILQNGQKKG